MEQDKWINEVMGSLNKLETPAPSPEILAKIENRKPNTQTKGKYMIASLCHRITPNDTFSSLELVKDSMGSVVDKYIESSLKQLGSKLR